MESRSSSPTEDRSFQRDSRVRSFHLYPPVRWKDIPLNLLIGVLAVMLLTGLNFATSKLLGFLNRETLLVLIGACVGIQLVIWILRYRSHSASGPTTAELGQVSDRVRSLAADPSREIEAVKALREETGMGLAEAKAVVESLAHPQKQW